MSRILSKFVRYDSQVSVKNWNLYAASEALVIANTTLLAGMLLYQLVQPSSSVILFFAGDLDINLISVLLIWISVISNPINLGLLVVGWTFAGVYVKRKYGDIASSTLLRASSIPVTIALMSVGIILVSLLLSSGLFLLIIFEILLLFGILYIFSAIFAIPGLILSQFISFNNSYPYELNIEKDYLVLDVLPESEKVSFCPFRSDLPGCSYLGYTAPEKPLICDYESSYLRCRVYSHIYNEYMDDEL